MFVCYDSSLQNPFENLTFWMQAIHDYAPDDIVVFLIGNKMDKANENKYYSVNRVEATKMMKQNEWKKWKGEHMACSAKTGQYVELIFKTAVEAVVDLRLKQIKGFSRDVKANKFDEYKRMQTKARKEVIDLEKQTLKEELAALPQKYNEEKNHITSGLPGIVLILSTSPQPSTIPELQSNHNT